MMIEPEYYIFGSKPSGPVFLSFKEKEELNCWLKVNGNKYSYLKVISGFTLEERRK